MGKSLGGGAVLAAIVLGVAIFTIAGGFAPESSSPVPEEEKTEAVVEKAPETKTTTTTGTKSTTPTSVPKTETQAPAPIPVKKSQPYIVVAASHPSHVDAITIRADAPNLVIDLAGWKVRSTVSGKTFTIPTLLSRVEDSTPMAVRIGSNNAAATVHTVGFVSDNHFSENAYHLYFGEQATAWKERDTIQLVSPDGEVVDTYTY